MSTIKKKNSEVFFSTIIKITLFFSLLFLIYELKELVLIFLTAIVLSATIEPFVYKMESFKIPRIFSVSFVYIILISVIFWVSILIVPSIIDQINNLVKTTPASIDTVNKVINNISNGDTFQKLIGVLKSKALLLFTDFSNNIALSVQDNAKAIGGLIFSFFGGLLNFILILVFSFYLALQDHGVENFLKIVIPIKHIEYSLDIWRRTKKKIVLWMQGQFILMLIIGLITYVGLKVLFDFEQSLLLGIIAGFTEIIPIVGPFIAAIPAIIIAFTVDGFSLVILIASFYFVVQMIENQLIYPLVVKKVVGVPSIVVILSLVAGVQLFGFLGAILAIPISAAFMEYFNDVEKGQKELLKKRTKKRKIII